MLNNADMPMQVIFAGKAHPADRPAHEVVKNINDIAHREGFRGRVFLVENYNMTLARNLVQGVDVWMNNPRRPLEASGTSGQKVCINGVLNFSILDGWWCEGFNGKNGWVIGDDTPYDNEQHQDDADSKSIYETLEKEILPLYYTRNAAGIPTGWVRMMKESIRSLTPVYGTHRMVQDYAEMMYVPCIRRIRDIVAGSYDFIRQFASWKQNLFRMWPQVQIIADRDIHGLSEYSSRSGEEMALGVTVVLGSLKPEDVRVEIYYGLPSVEGIVSGIAVPMRILRQIDASTYEYGGQLSIDDGGEYAYSFRVVPNHPGLFNKTDLPLIRWATV
jgi:starch phosphorylase